MVTLRPSCGLCAEEAVQCTQFVSTQENGSKGGRSVNDRQSESLKDTENVNFIRADTYMYLNAKNHLNGIDSVHINDDRWKTLVKLMKHHLNNKFGMTPYKEYSARSDNSSRAGKFSHFRKNHHTGNWNSGYMQNDPVNHWNSDSQNRGPRYNDWNKTQVDYLRSMQNQYQRSTAFIYLFVCVFFGVYRLTWEFFTYIETSPLPVKGCKFWPMLGTLRNGPTVYNGQLRGPMTLTLLPSFWQWSCHYLFLWLGSVATGDRTSITRMRGERSTTTSPRLCTIFNQLLKIIQ